jgi:capsular polysaccharide biosynthesis protein
MYNGNDKTSAINSQQVIDYKQIALTHLVIDEVLKNTGTQISYEDFEKSVVVQTLQDSSLFTVGFRSTDPETARKISDELARQLTLAVHNIVGSESLQILDQALLPDKPISPTKLQNAIIGGLLGGLISLAICLAGYLFNDTIRDETDIELLVEAPVLGTIPKYRGGDS